MTSTPDEFAASARELALSALYEITPAATVGPAAGYAVEEGGVVSLRFENRLPGYPGWYWTVSVAEVEDAAPTVLEVELMPGDSALLAPDWVPWTERLAEYRANQAESAEQTVATDDHSDAGSGSDEPEADDDDGEDDEGDLLNVGDLDGVDIDELDEDAADEDADDENE